MLCKSGNGGKGLLLMLLDTIAFGAGTKLTKDMLSLSARAIMLGKKILLRWTYCQCRRRGFVGAWCEQPYIVWKNAIALGNGANADYSNSIVIIFVQPCG